MPARGLLGRFRALGQALVELLQAELDALAAELRSSAATLRGGVVLLAIAGFFAFWTIGALAYAAVELLALWLPRWGAVLAAAGLFGLLAATFALAARARFGKLESPARTVGRRLESHRAWLRRELLPAGSEEAGAPGESES